MMDYEDNSAIKNITLPICFTIFFSVLNGTMFQVAVPDIALEFQLFPSQVSWVMTAYIIVFAVGSLMYGKLADIYPLKNLITIGIVLLNLGSLAGFFARWYAILILARLLQAAGGAAIPALAMITVTRYVPRELRGRMLGFIASTVALAAGIGPLAGGLVSGYLHWRYLFIITAMTVFAVPCLRRHLPAEIHEKRPFDAFGAVLVAIGVTALLLSVTEKVWWYLPIGILALVWLGIHTKKVDPPFINPAVLGSRRYRNTLVATFLSTGTVFGMMFLVPILLRDAYDLKAEYIGIAMFPGAFSAFVMGFVGGRLSDRVGSVPVVYAGLSCLIGGFFLISFFSSSFSVALFLIVCYTGFSFLQSSLPHTVTRLIPREHTGVGMGMYNLLFFISGAFSTSAVGSYLDRKVDTFSLNPFQASHQYLIYRNLMVMLAAAACAALIVYAHTFGVRMSSKESGIDCD